MLDQNHAMEHRTLIVDGHVHIYPHYDWHKAVSCLANNLSTAWGRSGSGQPVIVGLLAESKSCDFFNFVSRHPEGISHGAMRLKADTDPDCIIITNEGKTDGYLIAGRQVVTAEKLEILSLGVRARIEDGLPADTTVATILSAGAIPVLSWSPGKWFGRRGALVRRLIGMNAPDRFLIGDTGLRPTLWPFPALMKLAQNQGFKILGGSDALPLAGEEHWVGTCGVTMTAEFDASRPADSLRRILADPSTSFTPVGKRARTAAFLSRWLRNQFARKGAVPITDVIHD